MNVGDVVARRPSQPHLVRHDPGVRLIEYEGTNYHVTFTQDWDVYGEIVEFRYLDDPSARVLVRVTGWNDSDDLHVNVTTAAGVDPQFTEFAVQHARALIGAEDEHDSLDPSGVVDAPLTRARLEALLDAENVSGDSYELHGGRADEALVMEERGGAWIVYYAERGLRSGERTFQTEDEACRFMLDRLLRDPSTRRQ